MKISDVLPSSHTTRVTGSMTVLIERNGSSHHWVLWGMLQLTHPETREINSVRIKFIYNISIQNWAVFSPYQT